MTGVNAGYSTSKGEVKENGTTHTNSTVTASDKLTIESGKDTSIVGGKVSGDSVEMNVGGDLKIESEQDSQYYDEKYTSGGLSIDVDLTKPKKTGVGIGGGASSGKTNSDYESVTDQSGIYAGEGGFDITVDKNTDLKGGVIDSDATPDKNKLTTGTLTWEDVDNKAEYSSKYVGINVNINNGAKDNEKGVTPNIGMPAKGEDESTTKAGVAAGTVEITDKEHQKQKVEELNRDTKNTLNKLEQIFDKQTVAERKEMASLFGELAYNVVHNIDGTPEQKAALHALVGGIMGELGGSGFLAGASGAAVNKLLSDELKKVAGDDPALHQWLSVALGAVVSDVVAGNAQAGASTAASGTKNNDELDAELAAQRNLTAEEVQKADEMVTFVDNLSSNDITYESGFTIDDHGNVTSTTSSVKDFDFASSLVVNGTIAIADLPSDIAKTLNLGKVPGYTGEINYIVAVNKDFKNYSGKDFGLAVLSDTAGYGLGKGAGALAGAILGSETTDNDGMKPFLVIYGGYVGANTAGGILGDKLSTEIKNKIAVSDKEKMEK